MPMLTFDSSHEHHSTYLDAAGNEVYLAHGFPRRILVEFDIDWARELWRESDCNSGSYTSRYRQNDWLDHLRTLVIDPDVIDEVVFCGHCHETPQWRDECTYVDSSEFYVCESCCDEYYGWCDRCESTHDSNYLRGTLDDTKVCDRCCRHYFTFCDPCDGYYRDEDQDEHQHDGSGCCESPALTFTMRNDGDPVLANDQRVTVTLPAGTIDAEGLSRIGNLLVQNDLGYRAYDLVYTLGDLWQTKQGNFTKRLSRALYKELAIKIEPAVLSQVGCIARDHSTAVDFAIEITRDLNQSAEEFGHEDSCWWQSYFPGRCALKSNGGFGLRTFDKDSTWSSVTGRSWVMPLNLAAGSDTELEPTFDTMGADAFVVFNGYGDLGGYAATRIVAHMSGFTYRKVSFTCSPMYVNGEMGYLVAPEEIAQHYTDGSLRLSVDQHANLHNREQAAALAALATNPSELTHA